MDFGKVLDDWDRMTAKPAGKKSARTGNGEGTGGSQDTTERIVDPLTAWLRTNQIPDKDEREGQAEAIGAERRRRLREKAADATIDLHGLTRDEAWARLEIFFSDAKRMGLEKVLVIHGKGNHSEGEAVLTRTTRTFVEKCAFAGEFGHADRRGGGTGATWVVLRQDYPSVRDK